VLVHHFVPERFCQYCGGGIVAVQREGYGVKAFEGHPGLNLIGFPSFAAVFLFCFAEVEPQAVRILEGQLLFPKSFTDDIVRNMEFFNTFFPESQTAFRYGISDFRGHTGPVFSRLYPGPWKKREDGSWTSY